MLARSVAEMMTDQLAATDRPNFFRRRRMRSECAWYVIAHTNVAAAITSPAVVATDTKYVSNLPPSANAWPTPARHEMAVAATKNAKSVDGCSIQRCFNVENIIHLLGHDSIDLSLSLSGCIYGRRDESTERLGLQDVGLHIDMDTEVLFDEAENSFV